MEEVKGNSNDNKRGILAAKVLFAVSFLMPYLISWSDSEYTSNWLIQSPTWIAGVQDGQFLWGFTPTTLIAFQYWIFYPVIGYLSIKYSQGRYSSAKSFIMRIAFVILFVLLFSIMPLITYYSQFGTYLPIPIVPIVTLLMMPLIRPQQLDTPWDKPSGSGPDVFEEKSGAEGEI